MARSHRRRTSYPASHASPGDGAIRPPESAVEESKFEAPPSRRLRWWTWRGLPVAAIVSMIVIVLVYSLSRRSGPDIPRLRFRIEAPEAAVFTNLYGGAATRQIPPADWTGLSRIATSFYCLSAT